MSFPSVLPDPELMRGTQWSCLPNWIYSRTLLPPPWSSVILAPLQTSGQSPLDLNWTDCASGQRCSVWGLMAGPACQWAPWSATEALIPSLLNPQVSSLQNCHFYPVINTMGKTMWISHFPQTVNQRSQHPWPKPTWTDLILMVHSRDFLTLFFVHSSDDILL